MLYNALIRTHHITSRKKVAALKRAADTHQCFVLLRSGGCPGIMYVEGRDQAQVESWVGVVRKLRYKDFQLVTRPGQLAPDNANAHAGQSPSKELHSSSIDRGLSEVDSVKEFGGRMAQRGGVELVEEGNGIRLRSLGSLDTSAIGAFFSCIDQHLW